MAPENRNHKNKNCETVHDDQQHQSKNKGSISCYNHENQNSSERMQLMTGTPAVMRRSN